MYDNQSRGISYAAGFFMLIAFAVAGFVFVTLIRDNISKPPYTDVQQLLQVLSGICGFLIPSIITAAFLNRKPLKLLGYSGQISSKQVGLVFFIMISALVVSTSLSYFNYHIPIPAEWRIKFDKLEEEYSKQVEEIVKLKTPKDYILALFIMAFLPALCEESFFRGGLQNFLTRSSSQPWLSIIIVSIIFSLAHFSFYGFLYRFFLGAVLGALYHYSGRLWLSIIAHFLNNAFALTILYVYAQQGKSLKEGMQAQATSYWGILALPLVIGLFVAYKNASATNRRLV